MNNNNNAAPPARRNRKRGRGSASGADQAPPKKQKTQAQQRRQRRRRAQRDGRAQSGRGGREDHLTGRGRTQNRSGYGNKASMPIWESEYIAEIQPTAEPAFSLQQFPVNPGQQGTFPWLSKIAQNFEKYEFEFLRFCYRREVSEFATNGVTGKVIMSFDSDAADPAPTTKQQMLDTDPHADGMPCESFELEIPQDILQKLNDAKFVRPGAQPANTDLKTYDIGTLNVACQGTAANTVVGELHVEYALRLRIPILEANATTYGVGTATMAAATVAAPFNAAVFLGSFSMSAVGTTLTMTNLVVGAEYMFQYGTAASGSSNYSTTIGTPVGCTLGTVLGGDTYNWGRNFVANATTASFVVTCAAAPGNAQASVTQLPTGNAL